MTLRLQPLLLAITLVPAASIWAQSVADAAASDEIIHMSSEEPAMRRAFTRAAATLPEFLALASKPKDGTSSYALKVAVSDGRSTEYFWVKDFSNEGDVFTGVLNNEPRTVKKHKLGDRFTFRRTQVVDWTYIDRANRMAGNFTACALLTKEPPEQAAAFKRQYGLACEQ